MFFDEINQYVVCKKRFLCFLLFIKNIFIFLQPKKHLKNGRTF